MSTATEPLNHLNGSYVASVFDPIDEEFEYCAANGFSLSPGQNHGWVMRTARVGDDDGAVLACIEDSEDQFELVQVVGGFRWSRHDTLHAALQRFIGDGKATGLADITIAARSGPIPEEWFEAANDRAFCEPMTAPRVNGEEVPCLARLVATQPGDAGGRL